MGCWAPPGLGGLRGGCWCPPPLWHSCCRPPLQRSLSASLLHSQCLPRCVGNRSVAPQFEPTTELSYLHLTEEEPGALPCAAIFPRQICFNEAPWLWGVVGTAGGLPGPVHSGQMRRPPRCWCWQVLLCDRLTSWPDCGPSCRCFPSPTHPRPLQVGPPCKQLPTLPCRLRTGIW